MSIFNKLEVEEYFNVIGLDDKKIKDKYEKRISLDYISELYRKINGKNILPGSSKKVSDVYAVLLSIIKDDFWYETKEDQQRALESAIEIIGDLSCFQVTKDFNPQDNFERTSNLIATIISGLCACEDITKFRLYQRNASFKSLYYSKKDYGEMTEDLRKLYLLMAYSKFEDVNRDHEMFDENNQLSFEKLSNLIKKNVKENVPLKDERHYDETKERPYTLIQKEKEDKPLQLTLRRPTLKQLREL